ncbi:MAG: type II secretion system secretin GspD [Lautropia sp.]
MLSALGAMPAVVLTAEPITLNFKDADIDSVVGAFGHLLNRTFVIDPRVRGKITLETPRPVNRDLAFSLLKTVLRQQGFAVIDAGSLVKIVPEADAKLQSGPVEAGRVPSRTGDEIVTQIFQLSHESASNMIPILRPLVSPNNTITAFPNNNSLVITDYAANLNRLSRIIANLDNPRAANDVEVVTVRNAIAADIAVAVSRLIDETSRGGGAPGAAVDPGQRVTVLADPRTNTVLLRTSSAAKMQLAKSLVERLDMPANEAQANMRVIYLRNAEAVKLVEVLRAVLAGDQATGAGGLAGGAARTLSQQNQQLATLQNPGQQNALSQATQPLQNNQQGQQGPVTINAGGAIIAADPATNSLIVTAPEPVYRNIRAVIDKLDSRRAQVYIESLIVEVSADKAAELGIQWQFLSPSSSGGNQVIGGTNLPARGSGGNIIDATANILSLGTGLNIGLVRSSSVIGQDGTSTVVNLGLLARALETHAGANVKATPNLLTLDNEEARIIIGQNVPFITGQYTGVAGTAVANPFQTIERKDVGTTLRVRPQVSEGGVVKMQIFQEVSNVQDASLAAGLVTSRRAIESNVLVDDGQVVVLGGLIEDRVEGSESKVPILGDIPLLGRLFRYDTRSHRRTNLLVFLRPTIIKDPAGSWDVTANRYDYMRTVSSDAALARRWPLPQYESPPAEPLPARPGTPGAPVPPREPVSIAPGVGAVLERRGAPAQPPLLDLRERGDAAGARTPPAGSDAGQSRQPIAPVAPPAAPLLRQPQSQSQPQPQMLQQPPQQMPQQSRLQRAPAPSARPQAEPDASSYGTPPSVVRAIPVIRGSAEAGGYRAYPPSAPDSRDGSRVGSRPGSATPTPEVERFVAPRGE